MAMHGTAASPGYFELRTTFLTRCRSIVLVVADALVPGPKIQIERQPVGTCSHNRVTPRVVFTPDDQSLQALRVTSVISVL